MTHLKTRSNYIYDTSQSSEMNIMANFVKTTILLYFSKSEVQKYATT